MYCVGLVKRSSSSTAPTISSGSASTASRCSGCEAKRRTPLAISFDVVSCPPVDEQQAEADDLLVGERLAVDLGLAPAC